MSIFKTIINPFSDKQLQKGIKSSVLETKADKYDLDQLNLLVGQMLQTQGTPLLGGCFV